MNYRHVFIAGGGLAVLLTLPSAGFAQSLGSAEIFAVLAGSTVTNTGATTILGSIGVSPGTGITGIPGGQPTGGSIHDNDAVAAQAHSDLALAYTSLAGMVCPPANDLTGQDLGGKTLGPGVYCFSSSAGLTGTLTLDGQGDAGAVFVIQIGSTLTTAGSSAVTLINGALNTNVYWQVGSSATLDLGSTIYGNIVAMTSITLNTGARVHGRVLARDGQVSMDTNDVGDQSTPTLPTSWGKVKLLYR